MVSSNRMANFRLPIKAKPYKMKSIIIFLSLMISVAQAQTKIIYSDPTHEAEHRAIQMMKPVEFTLSVMKELKPAAPYNGKEYQQALHLAVEKHVNQKRGILFEKFKSHSISISDAELFVQKVRSNLLKKLNQLTPLEYEAIIEKYGSHEDHDHAHRSPGGPCVNPDFEMCDFTDWNMVTGTVPYPSPGPFSFTSPTSTTSFSTVTTPTAVLGSGSGYDQHYICTGGTDAIGGFPMVSPTGGGCTAAIGDFTQINYGAAQISKTFLVSSGDAILTLNYAVCLQDAGHTPAEQPYFRMRVYDASGASITCAEYEAVAGDGQPGWVNPGTGWQYKPWTTVFIPLAPYLGQNVTVEFTVGDCAQGGHAGYAYVDASCDAMAFNMTAAAVCNGNPITITAPAGAASYLWNTGATTQSITTSVGGTYSVTVTPVTGSACAITLDTTIGVYPNPIADFDDDAPACAGVPINFTDESNPNGGTITQWAWDFGDGATSTLQNPSHPYSSNGSYTVTLTVTTSDGCSHTFTDNININGATAANITPVGPFCDNAAPVTLNGGTAGGTWSATCGACINATTGVFNPGTATIGNNTITYSLGGPCPATDTEVIVVNPTFDATVSPAGPFCNTNPIVTMTAVDPGGTWTASCGACINATTGAFDPSLATIGNNTITYSIAGACPATDNEIVVVNNVPVPTITPAGPFCTTTAPATLTAATPGGTWTATCGACINATTGVFDPSLATVGSNTITYTVTGSCPNMDTEVIDVQEVTIDNVVTTDIPCFGDANGTITITATGATQYSITGGAPFQATGNFTGLGPNLYNIVVQNAIGCQATTTATIVEPPLLTIAAGTLLNESCFGFCDGEVAALPAGGTTPYVVTWSGSGSGTGLTLVSLCPGTYDATVVDNNGCTALASTIVTGPTQVTFATVTVPETCPGACDGTITINASGGSGTYLYSTNGGGTFQSSNLFTNICTGNYNIEVEDNTGCSATGMANVSSPTALSITTTPDDTVCIGQTAVITAFSSGGTAPVTFTWDNGLPNGASHNVDPAGTTIYNVTATDANGCNVSESITVVENPPLAVVALSDLTICPGDSAPLDALVTSPGGGGPYTFVWTDMNTSATMNGQQQTVSPTVQTDYMVTLTDACGTPSATDVVTISIFALPTVAITNPASGCSPVVATLDNITANTASCVWDFGDGSSSNNCNEVHVYTDPGCYDVTMTVTTNDGCVVTSTFNNYVCVNPSPIADFNWNPNPTDVYNTDIQFTNLTLGGNVYDWDFAGLGQSNAVHPFFTFPDENEGTYNVCLATANTYGCVDTICHPVVIGGQFIIYVPNAFTPDADGQNDIFLPILQGEEPETYEFMVFNRWGELIFQSNNKLIGWDGNHKNTRSKEDVYVWKIRVKSSVDNERKQFYGHVTLLR